ncbi:cupin-like domain-containing protein [Bradyrhizobium sp. McL0616]|uniref:cupin-like domain-containing protein n=1 Tax=Bradyrhizobium sp. McL0616 TaxID=3415674 RepID=UPI003CF2D57B
MSQISAPLIELDWKNFQPWKVTAVRHRLSDHHLLQPDQLIELSKRLEERGRVRTHASSATADTPFNQAPAIHPNSSSAADTLKRIREAKAWLSLLNVQTDATYRQLVDQVLDSVRPLVEAKDPNMSYRGGWIFVTSPNTVTPFHIDKEHNFILQIQGRKTIYVWEPDDEVVVSQKARDLFHARHDRDLIIWKEEFRKRAHRFEVGPGDGAYMPSTAPHLVEVGDEPSITMSFTYYTDSTRRQSMLHYARGHLADRGIALPGVGNSQLLDQLVYMGATPVRATLRAARRLAGQPVAAERARYAHHKFS